MNLESREWDSLPPLPRCIAMNMEQKQGHMIWAQSHIICLWSCDLLVVTVWVRRELVWTLSVVFNDLFGWELDMFSKYHSFCKILIF